MIQAAWNLLLRKLVLGMREHIQLPDGINTNYERVREAKEIGEVTDAHTHSHIDDTLP